MKYTLHKLLQGPGKVLFVGIGNVLRKDDGIGVYIVNRINQTMNISKLIVEVSLENYISRIRDINPDTLILVDCIHFNREAGYADIVPVNDIKEFTMHSHNLSLKSISRFFTMEVFVLGIQPGDLRVGEQMTGAVKTTGDKIANYINDSILEIENKMKMTRKNMMLSLCL